jgi:3-oxoacyl-[acyl-carrier protein] reductase
VDSATLPNAFDLTDRVAIVTGAGSGIGLGISQVLAAAGATVVCADVNGEAAGAAAKAIESAGHKARSATLDVSRQKDVADLVRSTASEHGRLDIMCNNAGVIGPEGPAIDLSEDALDRLLAVNLKGVLFGSQEAARVMIGQGRGSIVNTASAAIDSPTPTLLAYGISKVGVVQVTRSLAVEVAPRGVRVNVIAPGLVETNITRRHYSNEDGTVDEARREAVLAPMREHAALKVLGTPEDMGWAALYLASDASRFVTGQILRPNGGTAMPW